MKTRLEKVDELVAQAQYKLNACLLRMRYEDTPSTLKNILHEYDAELESYVQLRIKKDNLMKGIC